jgi:hypothetical protein
MMPKAAGFHSPHIYPADIQPLLQSNLAAMADLDFAYHRDLEAIRGGSAEEWLKQTMMWELQLRHQERREPYVRQLEALQVRIRAMAA